MKSETHTPEIEDEEPAGGWDVALVLVFVALIALAAAAVWIDRAL